LPLKRLLNEIAEREKEYGKREKDMKIERKKRETDL
jgi:23S rRNA maturation mini-RNase III